MALARLFSGLMTLVLWGFRPGVSSIFFLIQKVNSAHIGQWSEGLSMPLMS